jgi:general secretion pathway protein I
VIFRSAASALQRGFVLLEVLVAAALAALTLGALFHSALSALRAVQEASHYQQAIARARAHLALAVHASPLIAGDWEGDDGGGFTWRLHVTQVASTTVGPVTASTPAGSTNLPLMLYALSVSLAWRDDGIPRDVQLDTEQIGQSSR